MTTHTLIVLAAIAVALYGAYIIGKSKADDDVLEYAEELADAYLRGISVAFDRTYVEYALAHLDDLALEADVRPDEAASVVKAFAEMIYGSSIAYPASNVVAVDFGSKS